MSERSPPSAPGQVRSIPMGEAQKESYCSLPAGASRCVRKSMIVRELHMDRSTVQRYYDELQAEFQRQG